MASGHVNRIKRPNTWLHRPMLQNVKKALANPEPSTHGTTRTCRGGLTTSAHWGKADIQPDGSTHFRLELIRDMRCVGESDCKKTATFLFDQLESCKDGPSLLLFLE